MLKKRLLAYCATLLLLLATFVTAMAGEDQPQTYLPVFYNPPPAGTANPSPGLVNGDFEAGHVGWEEFSALAYEIILQDSELPTALDAHSGQWATWLGGDYYETSAIFQTFTVPTGARSLTYLRWIASNDRCNPDYDIAGVVMDVDGEVTDSDVLDAFFLCDETSTYGWQARTVDISQFAGQRVELSIVAFTDSFINSNLFVDDVSLGVSSVTGAGVTEALVGTVNELALQRRPTGNAEESLRAAGSMTGLKSLLRERLVERLSGTAPVKE